MKQKIFILLLIGLGLGLFLVFGMRTYHSFARLRAFGLHPRATRDAELIQGWMSIHYISKAYRVPEQALFDALQIPPEGNSFKSLDDLNHRYAPSQPGSLLARVKTAVTAFRESQPTPPNPPTAP